MTGNPSTRSVGTEASGRSEPKSPTPMGGASVSEVLAAGHVEWVESSFDAIHTGPFGEAVHGHTWFVRICWPAKPTKDARWMLAQLESVLHSKFDHASIDWLGRPTNYDVARSIGESLSEVTLVEVWRGGRVPCGARWAR